MAHRIHGGREWQMPPSFYHLQHPHATAIMGKSLTPALTEWRRARDFLLMLACPRARIAHVVNGEVKFDIAVDIGILTGGSGRSARLAHPGVTAARFAHLASPFPGVSPRWEQAHCAGTDRMTLVQALRRSMTRCHKQNGLRTHGKHVLNESIFLSTILCWN